MLFNKTAKPTPNAPLALASGSLVVSFKTFRQRFENVLPRLMLEEV